MHLIRVTSFAIILLFSGSLLPASGLFAAPEPSVLSAQFTTAIKNQVPVDRVLILTNNTEQVFFYSEVRNFDKRKVIHRWEFDGKVMFTKVFDVSGIRAGLSSSKTLSPQQLGTWRVVVTDEKGWPLKAVIFKYLDSATNREAILPQ